MPYFFLVTTFNVALNQIFWPLRLVPGVNVIKQRGQLDSNIRRHTFQRDELYSLMYSYDRFRNLETLMSNDAWKSQDYVYGKRDYKGTR